MALSFLDVASPLPCEKLLASRQFRPSFLEKQKNVVGQALEKKEKGKREREIDGKDSEKSEQITISKEENRAVRSIEEDWKSKRAGN